jgi:signal transduction histidine kinase
MSVAARLNGRIVQLTDGRGLPHRAARVRLTLLYGALFLLSGAALMAIAYALLANAGFVFSLQSDASTQPPPEHAGIARTGLPTGLPGFGAKTHPSRQTLLHWRGVAQCMRRHGVSDFPEPRTSVPSPSAALGGGGVISDRDEAIFLIPYALEHSAAFAPANAACGFMVPDRGTLTAETRRRTQARQELLIQSGIALAGMSLLSLVLGWLMAGRVLAPLEDSYEAQRQFVANASHELRTPLTLERAIVEVALADPSAGNEKLRATCERVLAIGEQQERTIDALLALARSDRGLERRDPFDLGRLADRAIAARAPEIAGRGLRLQSDLGEAHAEGDASLAERLIANLVDNATRYNGEQGWLTVRTATGNGRAILIVANSGPVVPEDDVERLLRPFQRMGSARTGHGDGHGLGDVPRDVANGVVR